MNDKRELFVSPRNTGHTGVGNLNFHVILESLSDCFLVIPYSLDYRLQKILSMSYVSFDLRHDATGRITKQETRIFLGISEISVLQIITLFSAATNPENRRFRRSCDVVQKQ